MDKTCGECAHFFQHYGRDGWKYFEINCGHCVHPRLKEKKPDQKSCDKFRDGRPGDKSGQK